MEPHNETTRNALPERPYPLSPTCDGGRRLSCAGCCSRPKKVIVGQDLMLERMLVALLARGHILIEGVPGLAKTLAIKTLAPSPRHELQARSVHPGPRACRPSRHAHL